MIRILREIGGGLKTIGVLAFLLVMTAILSYGLQTVLESVGLGGLATGSTGPLVVVVGFVLAFAIAFGGLTLWYANDHDPAPN